jgi:coenzyme Q-binding protein COQ10
MPSFKTTRRVRHSAAEMFALVADVERYPKFVPLCKALKIRRRTPVDDGVEVLLADMEVGYRAIKEKFTSRVTLDRPRLKVLVEYVDGPFSHLENIWTFHDEPGKPGEASSRVEFFISYQFRSRMLGALMGSMFDAAFRKFAAAFEAQADAVYGAHP